MLHFYRIMPIIVLMVLVVPPASALTISFGLLQEPTDENNDDAWWYAGSCADLNARAGHHNTQVMPVDDVANAQQPIQVVPDEIICLVGHGNVGSIGEGENEYNGAQIANLLRDHVQGVNGNTRLVIYSCFAGSGGANSLIARVKAAMEDWQDGVPAGMRITGALGACAANPIVQGDPPSAQNLPFLVSFREAPIPEACEGPEWEQRATAAYHDANVLGDPCNAGQGSDTDFAACIYGNGPINTAMTEIVNAEQQLGCYLQNGSNTVTVQ